MSRPRPHLAAITEWGGVVAAGSGAGTLPVGIGVGGHRVQATWSFKTRGLLSSDRPRGSLGPFPMLGRLPHYSP
eukprot:753418-Hanusia_phi.AAC.3